MAKIKPLPDGVSPIPESEKYTDKFGTVKERFWKRVHKTDTCWWWIGGRSRDYGRLTINRKGVRAHRLSYELNIGPIADGLFVCHRCDHPLCVRPDHLFLGTHIENVRDSVRKGRFRDCRGEKNGAAKLTAKEVMGIRLRYASGLYKQIDLCREYKISPMAMSDLLRGKTWRHI